MDRYEEKFIDEFNEAIGDITFPEDLEQLNIFDPLYNSLSALNNKKRLKILFIIAEENRKHGSADLYASKIRKILTNKKNKISITEVAVGNFLKELLNADLIIKEKKKVSGKANLDVYKINPMGFNRIFLELANFREDFMDFSDNFVKEDFNRENQCLITVINGVDTGKSFLLNSSDGEVRIGRFGNTDIDDSGSEKDIILSNEYEAVTKVSKPHASFKFERGKWFIYEGDNTNGTYINNIVLDVSNRHLNNKDIIKLARGEKGVSLLCSLN